MAKSIRSKSKRTCRNKKREDSVYAATEAARLHRLSSKLAAIVSKDSEGNPPVQDEGEEHNPDHGNIFQWSKRLYFWIPLWDGEAGASHLSSSSVHSIEREHSLTSESTDAEMDSAKEPADAMYVDTESEKRISTHGPRGSRREEWRLSKGLDPKPKRTGMNRQGGFAGRRKAGRAKRRR